jgi:hypothetical protein
MDVREIRWDGVDWVDLAQDKNQWRTLVNARDEHSDSIIVWQVLK